MRTHSNRSMGSSRQRCSLPMILWLSGVIRRRMSSGFLFRDPLTTVRFYMELMGEYAVRMLEERIVSGREISVKVTVPTKLYVRDRVSRMSKLPAGSFFQPDDSFKS